MEVKEGALKSGRKSLTAWFTSNTYGEKRERKEEDEIGRAHVVELLWENGQRDPENIFSLQVWHIGQKYSIFSTLDMISDWQQPKPHGEPKGVQLEALSFPETVGPLEGISEWYAPWTDTAMEL